MIKRFEIVDRPIEDLSNVLAYKNNPTVGAEVVFEGKVRNHHDGKAVTQLYYEAHSSLAIKEGEKIVLEAIDRYGLIAAYGVHRIGMLSLESLAVKIGVQAAHRAAAFDGCRYIIDEIKQRLPIWKKEYYTESEAVWIQGA